MKRNVLVVAVVVCVLLLLGLAGWANWQNRMHLAMHQQAMANQAVLVADNAPRRRQRAAHEFAPGRQARAQPSRSATLSGEKVSLASYKGKAVQINFWATWCAPCKIETPWLVELEKQYTPQGFEILGVSFDDLDKDDPKLLAKDKLEIAKGASDLRITYPVLHRRRQHRQGLRRSRRLSDLAFYRSQWQSSRSVLRPDIQRRSRRQYSQSSRRREVNMRITSLHLALALAILTAQTQDPLSQLHAQSSSAKSAAVTYLFPEQVAISAGKAYTCGSAFQSGRRPARQFAHPT